MTLKDSRIERAVQRGPLSRFPRRSVEEWLETAVRLDAPQGSFIYHEHDEPRAGLVVEGLLRLFMSAPDGRQVTVRYARAGQLLGIPAVVGGPAPVRTSWRERDTCCGSPIRSDMRTPSMGFSRGGRSSGVPPERSAAFNHAGRSVAELPTM